MRKTKLIIEAGKFYKLRNGDKAEIIAERCGRFIGVLYEEDDITWAEDWGPSGRWLDGHDSHDQTECHLDIVAEWNEDDEWEDIDPSKITLDMLPLEARFQNEGYEDRWYVGHLLGASKTTANYFSSQNAWWKYCQVKKEPQQDNPKQDDGWIEWGGGKCPVDPVAMVEVRFRCGETDYDGEAIYWGWDHGKGDYDIVAYRIIE